MWRDGSYFYYLFSASRHHTISRFDLLNCLLQFLVAFVEDVMRGAVYDSLAILIKVVC